MRVRTAGFGARGGAPAAKRERYLVGDAVPRGLAVGASVRAGLYGRPRFVLVLNRTHVPDKVEQGAVNEGEDEAGRRHVGILVRKVIN